MSSVILSDYLRTPFGAPGGILQSLRAEELAAQVIRGLVERTGLDPAAVDRVYLGCPSEANQAEIAQAAALPESRSITIVPDGFAAMAAAVEAIKNGAARCCIVGGVESFSHSQASVDHTPEAIEAAEAIAERWRIKRGLQDQFALESHLKAILAREAGCFVREILPIPVTDGNRGETVQRDELPRAGIHLEELAAIKPLLHHYGTVTTGNSSRPVEGAAAMMICHEDFAKKHGLKPLVRITGITSAPGDDSPQGIGPIPAIEKVLGQAGRSKFEIGLWEIPEDFAAVSLAILAELDPDLDRVNPGGGSIAFGNPEAIVGIRMAGTLAFTMDRAGVKYGVAAGSGKNELGQALLLELAN